MAEQRAELRNARRRVADIQSMAAQIVVNEHVAVRLLTTSFRAFYYFFTVACLTVGLVTFVNGKHNVAAVWGGIGIALAVLWISTRSASRLMARAVQTIRTELAEALPAKTVGEETAADQPAATSAEAG